MSDKRLSATDRVRADIDELFADVERDLAEVLEEVAQLGVRLLMQSALEAEVTAFLGRGRYERDGDARPGHRNGYAGTSIKTTAGRVDLERPKVVGSLEKFSSRLLGKGVTHQRVGVAGDLRLGARAVGPRHRSRVGRGARPRHDRQIDRQPDLRADPRRVRGVKARALSEVELDYLFVDASHFKIHDGARAEPVLVAYGITTTSDPVFLHLEAVSAESTDACVAFLRDMVARGLAARRC